MPKATIHMGISNIIKLFNFLNLKLNKPKKTSATTDTNEHKEVILVVDFSDSLTATINTAYRQLDLTPETKSKRKLINPVLQFYFSLNFMEGMDF